MREPPGHPAVLRRGLRGGTEVALTVGTANAIGKMTATLEVQRAAREAGLEAEFIATGQTGIIIAGWGISVDAVVSDFVAGASGSWCWRRPKESDLILVEARALWVTRPTRG